MASRNARNGNATPEQGSGVAGLGSGPDFIYYAPGRRTWPRPKENRVHGPELPKLPASSAGFEESPNKGLATRLHPPRITRTNANQYEHIQAAIVGTTLLDSSASNQLAIARKLTAAGPQVARMALLRRPAATPPSSPAANALRRTAKPGPATGIDLDRTAELWTRKRSTTSSSGSDD